LQLLRRFSSGVPRRLRLLIRILMAGRGNQAIWPVPNFDMGGP
jgi:hypothetical protein